MFQREINEWLAQNGGVGKPQPYRNKEEKAVPIKSRVKDQEVTNYETQVTYTAHNGQKLTVVQETPPATTRDEQEKLAREGKGEFSEDGSFSPSYREVGRGDPDDPKEDTRSPETREIDANKASQSRSENAEAVWNRVNGPSPTEEDKKHPAYDGNGRGSGQYETHQARVQRENVDQKEADRVADRAEATRTQQERNQIEKDRVAIERERVEREKERDAKNAENAAGQLAVQQGQLGVQQGQLGVQQAAEERAAKGTTSIVGSPTYADKNISTYNPVKGEFDTVENPNYDEVRVTAEREKERIRLGIEAGRFSAEVGAQQYKEWHDKNVAVPLALAAERRAQSTERRQAQEAADRREQARRQNEIDRAKIGQSAAESAQANTRAMLPFMAGPEFGEQFSSAVNGLAAGGQLGTNAAAGINFTADAFEFDAPNWSKVAKNATREALKHLTPYDPDDSPYSVGDYTGIPMPDAATMGAAPSTTINPASIISGINTALPPYNPAGTIPINSGG